MLGNVFPVQELNGLARRNKKPDEFKSVRHPLVPEEEANGWTVVKRNRGSTRLKKPKRHNVLLEDRVWTVLHRMGFTYLSGEGGAQLILDPKDPKSPTNQLDIVAFDDEVAVVIECKSCVTSKKLADFAEDVAKHVGSRDLFIKSLRAEYPTPSKRLVKFAMFTSNVLVSDKDQARADEKGVVLFDENDLAYYESLVDQIGQAARFQFLSDVVPGHTIPGLEMVVPAVRARMGGKRCYTFPVSPEYLLKISYVSHRAKGKASDVDTYQRMLKKSRLAKIREYIKEEGIFPTNIVVNIDPRFLDFQRAKQEGEKEPAAVFGWLHIRPAYKAAWIIDGQHRLFAYAGHEMAKRSIVTVLAFDGLAPSAQARLFIDINAEQRKVKQSLLQELYSELHWDAADPAVRVRAIVSKAIQVLDTQADSAFKGRILKADEPRTDIRCITLTALFSALDKTRLFIARQKRGEVTAFGPLWGGENAATVRRTARILSGWFDSIRSEASKAWEAGAAEGGGLAMNDGVTVCVNVFRSVMDELEKKGRPLPDLDDDDLAALIAPYGTALGRYFRDMSAEQLEQFRSLRGVQGQTAGTRRAQEYIHREKPEYDPDELQEFLEQEKGQNNQRAFASVTNIERMLQTTVVEELKREFGEDETGWWLLGVPKRIRVKIAERIEEEGSIREKEANFDLIDYREIAEKNWPLFEGLLAHGTRGSKEARTKWIADVNDIRKTVMHASKGLHLPVTAQSLAYLQQMEEWLQSQIAGPTTARTAAASS
jgi:DNA sulfur modification protein DndB